MAKRRGDLVKDTSGQFFRQLGYKADVSSQPKFRLGKDKKLAELAYHRLGLLWDAVVAEYERRIPAVAEQFAPPGAPSRNGGPTWPDDALLIADAIRKHQHVVRLPRPDNVIDPDAYAAYIDHTRQLYGRLIAILPADEDAAAAGKESHAHYARHRARQSALNARIAQIPIPAGAVGQTLYAAIDAYADAILAKNKKESGRVTAANARRLKDSTPDMDLSDFGYGAIERMAMYWASRPETKARGGRGLGRPISIETVSKHIKEAKAFIRWVDRSQDYSWERPKHAEDALQVNLKQIRTDDEIAALRHGVDVFTDDQLVTIYRHATELERMFILLGLNAGMAQAEMISLRWDEVEDDPPTIKRVRRKSSVYGEFAMWPETWSAIQARRPKSITHPLVLITSRGTPYNRQRIANAWTRLQDRIERETGEVLSWWLPFKHLRKTAAQLVRDASDGEIAGVFLCHGKPVATDDLADVYSNRPFHRVAEALAEVRRRLRPMFLD